MWVIVNLKESVPFILYLFFYFVVPFIFYLPEAKTTLHRDGAFYLAMRLSAMANSA
jgi:hypothetical protein